MEPVTTISAAVAAGHHAVTLLKGIGEAIKASGKSEGLSDLIELQMVMLDLIQKHCDLIQDNAELKKQLGEAQAEEIRIHKGIEFRRGKRTAGKWTGFCPKCHMPAQDAYPVGGVKDKVVICSASCGWKVLMKEKLDDLSREIGIVIRD